MIPPTRPARGEGIGPDGGAQDGGDWPLDWQPVRLARHQAIVVAGHAGAADIGANIVNAASGSFADLAGERGTTHAVAAHAGFVGGHVFCRNQVELRVILGGEARPFGRIGTAGATALAVKQGDRAGTRKVSSQGKQP